MTGLVPGGGAGFRPARDGQVTETASLAVRFPHWPAAAAGERHVDAALAAGAVVGGILAAARAARATR